MRPRITRPRIGLLRSTAKLLLRRFPKKKWKPAYVWMVRQLMRSDWISKARAVDPQDIERFRRLKEFAGNNKDHEQALKFNVMEMQAKRWHKSNTLGLVIEFIFQKSSNYGRSEIRPFLWMVFLWMSCGILYYWMSNTVASGKFCTALIFSLGQMFSFVPISRTARSDGAKILFCEDVLPNLVISLATFQSLASIVLIFLFGLSLRNRFKV